MSPWRRRRERHAAPAARAADAVALGAYQRAARPGPHGLDALGATLTRTHGGLEGALGWLLLELLRHEDDEHG